MQAALYHNDQILILLLKYSAAERELFLPLVYAEYANNTVQGYCQKLQSYSDYHQHSVYHSACPWDSTSRSMCKSIQCIKIVWLVEFYYHGGTGSIVVAATSVLSAMSANVHFDNKNHTFYT